jgi:hypothetical protein
MSGTNYNRLMKMAKLPLLLLLTGLLTAVLYLLTGKLLNKKNNDLSNRRPEVSTCRPVGKAVSSKIKNK